MEVGKMGKKLKWVIGAVVLLGIGGAIGGMESEEPVKEVSVVTEQVEEETPAPKEEPKQEEKKGINKAEFDAIQNGMTYEEVVKIIGVEGEVMSESGSEGEEFHTIMYTWDGEGGFGANANAMFQDGAMINKAQFGLK
jgi:hypothetical protein